MKMKGCYCYEISLEIPGQGGATAYPAANSQQEAIDKVFSWVPEGTRITMVHNESTGKTWYPINLTKK